MGKVPRKSVWRRVAYCPRHTRGSAHAGRPGPDGRRRLHGGRATDAPRGPGRQGRPDRGAGERGGGRRVGRSAHADRGPRRPPCPARLLRRAPAPVVRHHGAVRGAARALPHRGAVRGRGRPVRGRAPGAVVHPWVRLVRHQRPDGRDDGGGARPCRAGPSRHAVRRQRPRPVGQQRSAAPHRCRPGGPGLARRRCRAPPGRLSQRPVPRGFPVAGARHAAVRGRAARARV